ncbi:DASH complex subunit dad2 [Lecanora helva]
MAYPNRPLGSSIRHPSIGGSQASTAGQSPMLVARINEKKVELENLKQLRDLSGGLAAQMQALEEKLATLSNGTEAIATVLSNWHNVLRAIKMASMKTPKAGTAEDENQDEKKSEVEVPLPQTLVRIPVEQQQESRQSRDGSGKSNNA